MTVSTEPGKKNPTVCSFSNSDVCSIRRVVPYLISQFSLNFFHLIRWPSLRPNITDMLIADVLTIRRYHCVGFVAHTKNNRNSAWTSQGWLGGGSEWVGQHGFCLCFFFFVDFIFIKRIALKCSDEEEIGLGSFICMYALKACRVGCVDMHSTALATAAWELSCMRK